MLWRRRRRRTVFCPVWTFSMFSNMLVAIRGGCSLCYQFELCACDKICTITFG